MKITIEMNNKKYCVEEDNPFGDANVAEAVEMFKGLLVCVGYHPCNVDDIMETESPWFSEKEKQDNMQGHLKDEDLSIHSRASEASEDDQERAFYLAREKKAQEYQENMYRQDEKQEDDDIFP